MSCILRSFSWSYVKQITMTIVRVNTINTCNLLYCTFWKYNWIYSKTIMMIGCEDNNRQAQLQSAHFNEWGYSKKEFCDLWGYKMHVIVNLNWSSRKMTASSFLIHYISILAKIHIPSKDLTWLMSRTIYSLFNKTIVHTNYIYFKKERDKSYLCSMSRWIRIC